MRKHGISLGLAESFDMQTAFLKVDDREDYGEVRYKAAGFMNGRLHAFIFTMQGTVFRAISLRTATKQEHKEYAENN